MLLEQSKEVLNRIIDFDNFVKEENQEVYNAIAEHGKVVKLLRKSNYKYSVYKVLSKIKTNKIKKNWLTNSTRIKWYMC